MIDNTVRLQELERIINIYDELAEIWQKGGDADDYAEDLDSLRNNGLKIINELKIDNAINLT